MKSSQQITFWEAFTGLILAPCSTMQSLLDQEIPPYAVRFYSVFILTIIVPLLAMLFSQDLVGPGPAAMVISVAVVATMAVLLFVILGTLFLRLLGFNCGIVQVFALTSYCVIPFTFALWLIFVFNFLTNGNLTLINYLLTHTSLPEDRFLRVLPLAFLIAFLNVFLVLFYGIRCLGRSLSITAFFVTIFGLLPVSVSIAVALYLGELAHDGTFKILSDLVFSTPQLVMP